MLQVDVRPLLKAPTADDEIHNTQSWRVIGFAFYMVVLEQTQEPRPVFNAKVRLYMYIYIYVYIYILYMRNLYICAIAP